MSRLDYSIGRLKTSRACIDHAVAEVGGLPGPILELGLGNGRTFDHLRESLPGRDIFVFELEIAAHPDCIPDDDHLLLGDIKDTLPLAVARFAGQAPLFHADVGSFDHAINAAIAAQIEPFVPQLMRPDGLVVTSVAFPNLQPYPLPAGAIPDTYFMYRPIPA
ncbi:MAG: class I SAM-dependent methyltransferase [Pseudomonadota bacterium]|nr:class I SAM-dependent methyltransferase [Pseudomonadota bacterium]